ncbi:hypothetical protein DV738_g1284, partial [Chaetothyriales sp. CBS 135597]
MARPASPAPVYDDQVSPTITALDSGYSSAANSDIEMPDVYFSKRHLEFINTQLQLLEPQDVLRWCVTTLPNLFQTTAFGLTGLVTMDMLSKLNIPQAESVEAIFLDTLHHFAETLDLVERVKAKYPANKIHIYRPEDVETEEEFASKYGQRLWETDEERYDYLVKVEPSARAYRELGVKAVLTGRRRSQGGKRGDLPIVEVDETGIIKVNPLANWSFKQVTQYIEENDVPFNILLKQGYKSVGDWHSTQPVAEGEDERSGRWKGQNKTECGLHNPKSKYAQYLREQEAKRGRKALEKALQAATVEV